MNIERSYDIVWYSMIKYDLVRYSVRFVGKHMQYHMHLQTLEKHHPGPYKTTQAHAFEFHQYGAIHTVQDIVLLYMIHVYIYLYKYIYIYIRMHIYIYIYVCVYIYIYKQYIYVLVSWYQWMINRPFESCNPLKPCSVFRKKKNYAPSW